MGKRGEARPQIGARVQDILAKVHAQHGRAPPPAFVSAPVAKPLPSPARAETPPPTLVGAPASPSEKPLSPAPTKVVQPTSTPMSTSSTPIKSPDLKRLRSKDSDTSETKSLPPLPSPGSTTTDPSPDHDLRHADTATTLSLQGYMAQLAISGPEV